MTSERYPLSWPAGWKRTAPADRKRARFFKSETRTSSYQRPDGTTAYSSHQVKSDLTIATASRRLVEELGRLGCDDYVLSTNVEVRLDGMPRSDRKPPADPGVAVYFKLNRKDRCLACDRWDRVADNIAAIAAHIDALRAIERYGVGTMEQAFAGYASLPASAVDWRIVLGVDKWREEAITRERIDAQFKRLALAHHPDRGGDPAMMARLNAARALALEEVTA